MSEILENIKRDAKSFKPGILPPVKNFESLIGYTVINISESELTKNQVSALRRALPSVPPQDHLIKDKSGMTSTED